MKKLYKALETIFDGTILIGLGSLVAWFTLTVYALFAYPQAFFTTKSNFEPLESVAPVLNNFVTFFMVFAIAMGLVALICYETYKAVKKAKKNRR